ncbi:unnamed protein product [Symbiodinium microadriaticum]|nr:unnamed protein product [Symbiodinium microadriaticum]
MKFPLPVVDAGVIYSSTVASSPGCGVAANAIERGKDSQPCTTVVTVVCIDFHHIEDVVKLWLDNVKIFSVFASSEPAEVSKNATFCLKAILFAGQLTALPSSVWMEAMTEMLNRLPLNLDKAVKEFQLHGSTIQLPTDKAPRQLSGKDHARLMEMCLRCTAVVFDCMVYHFKALRNFENFQTLWLKYVTTLAQNAHFAASSSDMKGESVDMIGSLLRLLHHPPVSDTGITHAKETAGSIAVVSADNKKPANSSGEGEHKAVSDETLMLVSWRAAKAGCPSLVALLQHNHPLIVQTILTLENKQNTEKGDIGGEENGAGRMPSTNGDQRSFYSRLFEFKSQIV